MEKLPHTVCHNSVLQVCSKQCARKVICIRKTCLRQIAATMSRKLAASLRQVCGLYVPETLYFGKGNHVN